MNKINCGFVGCGMKVFPDSFVLQSTNKSLEATMQQLKERWKPIKNYENLYEISNYGRVKSLTKKWKAGYNNTVTRTKKESFLKPQTTKDGYYRIGLYINSKIKVRLIHQLVWEHFGNKMRNGIILQIDHKDENKLNNKIDNLQLLSLRENRSKYCILQKKSSKYIGVCWRKDKNRWASRITINGKLKFLGYSKDEYIAHLKYQKALKEVKDGKV